MSITRRKLLQYSAGAGLMAATGPWQPLMAETGKRIMTTIPSSGEQLPAVGIGTRDFRSNANAQDMAIGANTWYRSEDYPNKAWHYFDGRISDFVIYASQLNPFDTARAS